MMRVLAIIAIIAYTAVTSCNKHSSNSNNKSNSSDSSSKNTNMPSKSDSSVANSNKSASAGNKDNKNIADNTKKDIKPVAKFDYEVNVGASFSIELASNPTTGYRWHWVNKASVSTVDTTKYSYIRNNPGMMGSGGKEIWTFTGRKAGTDSLKFQYNRSWEKKLATNFKVFTVKVN